MSEWWAISTKAAEVPDTLPVEDPPASAGFPMPDMGECSESGEGHTRYSSDIRCRYCDGYTNEYCDEDHDSIGCPDCDKCTTCKKCSDCDFDGNCDHSWYCRECGQRFDVVTKGPYAGSLTVRQ
jgi:hypothetical protein